MAGPDGRFGGKGLAIKAAVLGGVLGGQWLVARRLRQQRDRKVLYVVGGAVDFTAAGLIAKTVVHNYTIK